MKRLRYVVVVLLSAAVLSSCALVPFGPQSPSDRELRDARMEQIAAAVNAHDAAALKALFSAHALDKATDIDERLQVFLSFFPNGGVTWTGDASAAEGSASLGAEILQAYYKLSADGVDYSLFFADFTVNETDPDNVGLYALGVAPWADDRTSGGSSDPFFTWAGSVRIDESNENGYPGVYTPPDTSQLSLQKLIRVLNVLNDEDKNADSLRALFSEYAQLEHATEIDDELDEFYALFPEHDVVRQEDPRVAPVVRENVDNGEKQSLLLSTNRVSSGGADYWLFFAYFTENTVDSSNLRFYALGVAPWTESGDSAAEQALFSWADSFDVDASAPPGVFISQ